MSITYSECVFVALGMQHAIRMRRVINCGLLGCIMFLHIILQKVQLSGKKKVIEHKMCFDFLCKVCLTHLSF